jgi:CheY-like chemotaxis protein
MIPPSAKPQVLVVDDHPANRRAFESILEQDYAVTLAANGHQALELILREEYAVILLDVRMPGLDGFEVADLLRKRDRTRHTPILFMSAYDQNVIQMKRGYVAGATDFIFSPVDEELLKFKVAAYVQIYLRDETMRLQIQRLSAMVQSLEGDVRRRGPAEEVLKSKIRELESMVEGLRRQMEAVPS